MKEKDNCEICNGSEGCVLGNEQVVDGVIMCDNCHANVIINNIDHQKDNLNK